MKITIITAVYNGASSIDDALKSVIGQTHKDLEYIVVDGGSKDGTVDIIKKNSGGISRWVSERDRGIYDALNKGLSMATGNVIGFLHADDFYADDKVLEKIASVFQEKDTDSCYGDLVYVSKYDTGKVIRYWRTERYRAGLLRLGWMPPHPTFFVKSWVYRKYGCFNTDFKIAADYELILRFLEKHRITTTYIPDILVKMRVGGVSNRSIRNLILKTREDYHAWDVNGLYRSFYTIPLKNLSKIPQFFRR